VIRVGARDLSQLGEARYRRSRSGQVGHHRQCGLRPGLGEGGRIGDLPIPAHIEKDKGLMRWTVPADFKEILLHDDVVSWFSKCHRPNTDRDWLVASASIVGFATLLIAGFTKVIRVS
jgi:hypothetical protein